MQNLVESICISIFLCIILFRQAHGGLPVKIGHTAEKAFYHDENPIDNHVDFEGFMQYCYENGMQGATIKNAEEQKIIEDYYLKTNFPFHFRLGGIDFNSSGYWMWLDDYTYIKDSYENWDVNHPDQGGGIDQSENCLVFLMNTTKWNDFRCTWSPGYKALCQKLL